MHSFSIPFITQLQINMINKKQIGMSVKRSAYGPIVAPLLQFHGGNEEDHGTHHSRQPVSRLKSEPVTAQLNCKVQ